MSLYFSVLPNLCNSCVLRLTLSCVTCLFTWSKWGEGGFHCIYSWSLALDEKLHIWQISLMISLLCVVPHHCVTISVILAMSGWNLQETNTAMHYWIQLRHCVMYKLGFHLLSFSSHRKNMHGVGAIQTVYKFILRKVIMKSQSFLSAYRNIVSINHRAHVYLLERLTFCICDTQMKIS